MDDYAAALMNRPLHSSSNRTTINLFVNSFYKLSANQNKVNRYIGKCTITKTNDSTFIENAVSSHNDNLIKKRTPMKCGEADILLFF